MSSCPACSRHEWPPTVRGRRTCPRCRARLALTVDAIVIIDAEPILPATGRAAGVDLRRIVARDRAERRRALDAPELLTGDIRLTCANCNHLTSVLTGLDGHLKGDGRMTVERVEEHFGVLITREVKIPCDVRGVFCRECVRSYPVRPVGRMRVGDNPDDPLGKRLRFSLGYDTTQEQTPVKHRPGRKADAPPTYRIKVTRVVDPDPTWAHTGDSSWISTSISQEHQRGHCVCPACSSVIRYTPEVMPTATGLARGIAEYRLNVFSRQIERRRERLTPSGILRPLPRIAYCIIDVRALVGSQPIPDPRPTTPPMPELPRDWVDLVWRYETTAAGDTVRIRRHIPPCVQPGPAPNPRVVCRHGLPIGQCALCLKR